MCSRNGCDHNQSGLVSFTVTLIMMLVITLIILGFAQISRRESQQTLDRQLSAQAYYAAETGINDAKMTINDTVNLGNPIQSKDVCGPTVQYPATPGRDPQIDPENQIEYTCLLVDTSLPDLTVDLKANGDSENIPYEPAFAGATDLKIDWKPTAVLDPTAYALCDNNIPSLASGYFDKSGAGGWDCPFGVLRMDIVSTAALDRASLLASQKTLFLYPTRSGGSSLGYAGMNGRVQSMNCQIATNCDVTLTGVPAGKYAIRFNAIYQDGTATVSAVQNGTSTSVDLNNAQVLIDSTGKAQDTLRRIQVRLPLNGTGKTPDYPLESGSSVCKRFEITAPFISNSTSIVGQDQNNPMCAAFASLPPPPPPVACTLPTDIIAEIDTSLSMDQNDVFPGVTRREKMIEMANIFFSGVSIGPTEPNRGGIIGFSGIEPDGTDNSITVYQPLTSSVATLTSVINGIPLKYGTRFTAPLQKSTSAFVEGQYRVAARKVIVFFSDGVNPANDKPTSVAAADVLKSAGVTIYAIGISADADIPALQSIASPGKFYSVFDSAGFASVIAQISAEVDC